MKCACAFLLRELCSAHSGRARKAPPRARIRSTERRFPRIRARTTLLGTRTRTRTRTSVSDTTSARTRTSAGSRTTLLGTRSRTRTRTGTGTGARTRTRTGTSVSATTSTETKTITSTSTSTETETSTETGTGTSASASASTKTKTKTKTRIRLRTQQQHRSQGQARASVKQTPNRHPNVLRQPPITSPTAPQKRPARSSHSHSSPTLRKRQHEPTRCPFCRVRWDTLIEWQQRREQSAIKKGA